VSIALPIVMLFLGLALGAAGAWLLLRGRGVQEFERGRRESAAEAAALNNRITQLVTSQDYERQHAQEKLALLEEAKTKLSDAFKALAAETLQSSNTAFLELARTQLETFHRSAQGDLDKRQTAIDNLVKPVKESLGKVDATLQEIEKTRIEAYSGLKEQVQSLRQTQDLLKDETANLVQALRRPQVRGRWGEIQLRRVVEMAGMLEHCDFTEQETVGGDETRLRPDLIVHLPGRKQIVVDAKAPLSAYLDAVEAPDEPARALKLQDHARQVREHIKKLSGKAYYEQFAAAPDFVVLFLAGEVFLSAAWECDPTLIELAIERNVIIATPTTLISLLRAVSYGWRQEVLAENAQQISALGKDLYDRIVTWSERLGKIGKGLSDAIKAYNDSIGSLESRVLPSARRFKELGATGRSTEIEAVTPVEILAREARAPELLLSDAKREEKNDG
jgi:DNA recombination protein RmuC